jgi:hypothetical protein
MFMPKKGISVTLRDDNLLWLKGRTVATKGRSLSETLDDLVTAARTSGGVPAESIRSVVGTVDIADDDPALEKADVYLKSLIETSLSRPFLVREEPPPYRTTPTRKSGTTGKRGKYRARG